MMTGHSAGTVDQTDTTSVVGGPTRHIPVLLEEVAHAIAAKPGETIVDGTFGAGGYTGRILADGASVIAIDRDPDAIAAGQELVSSSNGKLKLWQGAFSEMEDAAQGNLVDGVMLDIGVSSMQIDDGARGFSFMRDGPLDMRMAQDGVSAADVVNRAKVNDLIRIFGLLGEEKNAGRIAHMIERERAALPFSTTKQLADAIEKLIPRRHDDRIHPATRVFQALRIYVNDELGQLTVALCAAERILKPGGRLVVVTFHSLEDRIVKKFFTDRSDAGSGSRHLPQVALKAPTFSLPFKGVQEPSEAECATNVRARSAKLRAGIRTDTPARNDETFAGLPRLPDVRGYRV
ncbi:MAG: 16S rRNA (cytosine(1402)-N(4))-methyltransferase RsmH [Rhizobiaceae bacterium]